MLALAVACAARGDLPTSVDVAADADCAAEHPAVLDASPVLSDVAQQLAHGGELKAAIDRAGYATASAELLYLKSPLHDEAVRDIVAERYCVADRTNMFTQFGVYRSGNETWIVLAAPREPPAVDDTATAEARVLDLVNAARATPRRCGERALAAAPPLTLATALTAAAARHARDMAQHRSFSHVGSDGSRPAERVSGAGYVWRATGENIAAGQAGPAAVVAAWLDSPGHCANLMGAQYSQMGVAFALAPAENPAIYWALELAAPRYHRAR
jgi:uncharacterized protein YkwD